MRPETKREVFIAREAYLRGVAELHIQSEIPSGHAVGRAVDRVEMKVHAIYPLPKVKRERVVKDPRGIGAWGAREFNGHTLAIHYVSGGAWETTFPHHLVTAERVALWADLLANPTEEVEA